MLKSELELRHVLKMYYNHSEIGTSQVFFTGKQLKKLGLTFIKYTNENEIHGPIQYNDGVVEDIHPLIEHKREGLYFVAEGYSCSDQWKFWPPIFNQESILKKGYWQREVFLDDEQQVFAMDMGFGLGIVFRAQKLELGPRERIAFLDKWFLGENLVVNDH